MVCWGVIFAIWGLVGFHKTSEATWSAYVKDWLRHYGPSEIIVVDGGDEFKEPYVQNICDLRQLPTRVRRAQSVAKWTH